MRKPEELQPHERRAIRILGTATRGTFYPFSLTGKHHKGTRQQIFAEIRNENIGNKTVGVNALAVELFKLAGITNHPYQPDGRLTLAACEREFVTWCKRVIP